MNIISTETQLDWTELVEVPIMSVTDSIKFPTNNENIEKGLVTAISVISNAFATNSPNGNVNVSNAILQKSFLRLKVFGKDKIKELPLMMLVSELNSGVIRRFRPARIDFANSSIKLGNTTGVTAGTVFLINFNYSKPEIKPVIKK